jgi:hypothetical protein
MKSTQRNIVYEPPDASEIYQYTRTVCKDIGETLDTEFDTPEMRSELANFIKVIADICTQQMNKGVKSLDTEQSQR